MHRAEGRPPPGLLSMTDFNNLRSALELLVLWGLYPHLDAGEAGDAMAGLSMSPSPSTDRRLPSPTQLNECVPQRQAWASRWIGERRPPRR